MQLRKTSTINNKKVINCNFKNFNTYDNKEINAALNVIRSGKLSSFIGNQAHGFKGGEYVEKFEKKQKHFRPNGQRRGLVVVVAHTHGPPTERMKN